MSIIYLTFNKHARLYEWLQRDKHLCIRVTGKNPIEHIAKPLARMDLKPLPYTHADFPRDVQWWIDATCPYSFAKTGEGKANIILRFKMWWNYKVKKR